MPQRKVFPKPRLFYAVAMSFILQLSVMTIPMTQQIFAFALMT